MDEVLRKVYPRPAEANQGPLAWFAVQLTYATPASAETDAFRTDERYARRDSLYRFGHPWTTGGFVVPNPQDFGAGIFIEETGSFRVAHRYEPVATRGLYAFGAPWSTGGFSLPGVIETFDGISEVEHGSFLMPTRLRWRVSDQPSWPIQPPPSFNAAFVSPLDQLTESFRVPERYRSLFSRFGAPWTTGGFALPFLPEFIAGIISDRGTDRSPLRWSRYEAEQPPPAWIFTNLPSAPFNAAFLPALNELTESFRLRERYAPLGLLARFGAPWTTGGFALPLITDIIAGLLGEDDGYLMPGRRARLEVDQPAPGWLFSSIPSAFNPATMPAIYGEALSFRALARAQRWSVDPPEDGWLFSAIPPVVFNPTLYVGAAALLNAFRMPERAQRLIVEQPAPAFLSIPPTAFIPGLSELLSTYRMMRRPDRPLLDQPAPAWIFTSVPTVTVANTAAMTSLLNSFRSFRRPSPLATFLDQPLQSWIFAAIPPALVPVLLAISPDRVFVGSGPVVLTLTGLNFVGRSQVLFDGSPRLTTFVSATSLLAYLPDTDTDDVGIFSVSVFTGAPGGGTSNALPFTVLSRRPRSGWKWEMDRFGRLGGDLKPYVPNVLTIGQRRRSWPQKK